MKFVMTQAVCPEGMQLLDGIADVYVADNQDPNNYLDEMRDAAALIVRIAKCDANAIENSPKLKVIGRTGVGYDSVDVKKATELGIPVVITPGANNRSVAEHAVAMIFALSKNLIEAQNEMCKGNWEIRGAKKAFELEGKTVGILGLGAIGRETAKICKGCGMRIAAYDPFMTTTLIGSLFQTNKPIVINTIIIEIILESILYPPIYFYFKSLPSQHPSISRAHILTCRLHMATFYPLRLPDSP